MRMLFIRYAVARVLFVSLCLASNLHALPATIQQGGQKMTIQDVSFLPWRMKRDKWHKKDIAAVTYESWKTGMYIVKNKIWYKKPAWVHARLMGLINHECIHNVLPTYTDEYTSIKYDHIIHDTVRPYFGYKSKWRMACIGF